MTNMLHPGSGGGSGSSSNCDCEEVFAQIVLCAGQIGSCSTCARLAAIPGFGPKAVAACIVATGCISLADLWTGCSQLSLSCVRECAEKAYEDIGNPLDDVRFPL